MIRNSTYMIGTNEKNFIALIIGIIRLFFGLSVWCESVSVGKSWIFKRESFSKLNFQVLWEYNTIFRKEDA